MTVLVPPALCLMMVPVITTVNWKFKHDFGDIEKLLKPTGERGRGRAYEAFGTGEFSKMMRPLFFGTGERMTDLGALWNLREQGPV